VKTSDAGLDLIKSHEGLRLDAYLCPAGVWTIGYGHTGTARPGMRITNEQADDLLRLDVEKFEGCVRNALQVEVTQGQFDALVSFAFNVGCGALRGSTLLRLLNQGDFDGAAAQFARWNRGGGQVLAGLARRREDERSLFEGAA
jgi:lysozyme